MQRLFGNDSVVRALPLGLLVAVGSYGCGESSDQVHPRVMHDTIDGVEHVIGSDVGIWIDEGGAWQLDTAQSVVIGEVDGPAPYVFGRVAGAVLDPGERLYVGDSQALEIRVFSLDAGFLRSFGRSGDGPGEFRDVGALTVAPEGVAVLDGGLNRVTIFNPSGDVTRSFRLARSYNEFGGNAPMGFDPNGRFFDRVRLSRTPGIDSVGVSVYEPATGEVTTALLTVIEQDQVTLEVDGSPYMQIPRPFAPHLTAAFSPEGRVYLARGDEYRIEVYAPDGNLLRVIRRPVEATRVTQLERDSVVTLIADAFGGSGARLPGGATLPERRPVIGGLAVDTEEYLWVLQTSGPETDSSTWSVHDSDGVYLGDVEVPNMTVTQITGEFLVGSVSDDLGAQRVRILPILK